MKHGLTHRSWSPGATRAGALALLVLLLPLPPLGANPAPRPSSHPDQERFPSLHNLLQVSPQIYSGGEPHGPEAFVELARLGVKTIVSVDGAIPDVAEAKKHGLRYVHIPIGYDGISTNAALSLTRVVRDAEGPYYVHCHHGQHRGPAAAAIACIASGAADRTSALRILHEAGTSTNYAGLWRDVAAFTPPGKDVALPQLVEVAPVPSLAAAMATIDRVYDNLKAAQKLQWTAPPHHPDLVPHQQALLIREAFHESLRHPDNDHDQRFVQWLRDAETFAIQLEQDLQESRLPGADHHFRALTQSCSRCHRAYRN